MAWSTTCMLYPLEKYTFGVKDAQSERDANVQAKFSRLRVKYEDEGVRHSVGAVLLVHRHRHPHVLLLQHNTSNFFRLPGGRLRPGEESVGCLQRKLTKRLGLADQERREWEVGDLLSQWWRPGFEPYMYPYLPGHIKKPKEIQKLFLVHLPSEAQFAIPNNFSLLAIPLFELYGNEQRYGHQIASIPHMPVIKLTLNTSANRHKIGIISYHYNTMEKPAEKRTSQTKLRSQIVSAEEEALASLVFSGSNGIPFGREKLSTSNAEENADDDLEAEPLDFVIDRNRGIEKQKVWADSDDEQEAVNISAIGRLRKLRKDGTETIVDGNVYSERLREKFGDVNRPEHEWARQRMGDRKRRKLVGEDDMVDVDDVMRTSGPLIGRSIGSGLLPVDRLSIVRVKDANAQAPCKGVVQAVHFHPERDVLLTGSFDKTLRLFEIDGKDNPKVFGVYLPDLPISSAYFLPDGVSAIVSGRRKFFYNVDLVTGQPLRVSGIIGRSERSLEKMTISPDGKLIAFLGNVGSILLVSSKTHVLVAVLKMNGSVHSAAFSRDSSKLYTSGSDGDIYVWELKTFSCMFRFPDVGCVKAGALACSPSDDLLVAGSGSGIVNCYGELSGKGESKLLKSFDNLTTPVDLLKFNRDGQLLAMGSRYSKNGLRIANVQSTSVYSNWPTVRTPLRTVSSMDFSPRSQYCAVGNDRGLVLLYRLPHFE